LAIRPELKFRAGLEAKQISYNKHPRGFSQKPMPTLTDISTLIVSTPDTCGGRPRIANTRITVQYIVNEIKSGMTPEEIIEDKPYLTIAGIYTALAYYYANKESLDIEFTQYQEECQRLEVKYKTNY
jgi:uncharacterized protein (DUF433 family)